MYIHKNICICMYTYIRMYAYIHTCIQIYMRGDVEMRGNFAGERAALCYAMLCYAMRYALLAHTKLSKISNFRYYNVSFDSTAQAIERGIRRRVCVAWCSTALKQAQQRNKISSGAEAISRQCWLAHALHAFVRNRLIHASEKICKSLSAAEIKSGFDSSGGAATELQQSYNDEHDSSFSQAPEMQVESGGGQHCGKAPVGQHCDAAAERAGHLVCMRVCSA